MLTPFSLWEIFVRLRDNCHRARYALACVVAQGLFELDPLLRGYFTEQIRARVGPSFMPDGISTARLHEIHQQLGSCGKGDFLCMASLQIAEIEHALTRTLVEAIRRVTGVTEDGARFDPRGVATRRLAEIFHVIEGRSLEDLATSKIPAKYPEIEEVVRQRWIEATFAATRGALHADPAADITRHLAAYRGAVEAAFSMSFTVEDRTSKPWGFVAIHFVRLGLTAIARAFQRWVRQQLPPDDPRGGYPAGRFRLFRAIMGRMTFKHMNTIEEHFADSARDTIKIWKRDSNTQATLTPNTVIHELGHSLSNFAGFGAAHVGSIEKAAQSAEMPIRREGMGKPPYVEIAPGAYDKLNYLHARVEEDEDHPGRAEFISPENGDFGPPDYLLYDIFDTKWALWSSSYNIYWSPRILMYARVDIFVQNPNHNATEAVADAFLNWVRDKFDPSGDESSSGRRWRSFFAERMGGFLRNAAFYQAPHRMVPFYQAQNVIGAPLMGAVANGIYKLRLVPDNGGGVIGNADNLPKAQVPIYGRHADSSLYDPWNHSTHWLLVSTPDGKLAWIADKGLTEGSMPDHDFDESAIERLSPARRFEAADWDVILGDQTN